MIDDLKTLFVCATKRSGSTFICRWIGQQPDLPNVREWFQAFEINEHRRSYGLPQGTPLETVIRQIRENERKGDWFGFKIMWDNLVGILKKRTDPSLREASRATLVQTYFPHAKFIWLTRKNKEAQAVSLAKALQTGVWEVRPNGPKPVPREHTLRYSYVGLLEQLRIVEEEERQWAAFFEELAIEPLKIAYEDFKEDPPQYIAQIRRAMDLDAFLEAIPPHADKEVARTHDSINRTWLDRFRSDGEIAKKTPHLTASLLPPVLTGIEARFPEKAHPEPELNWECILRIDNPNALPLPRIAGPASDAWPTIIATWREETTGHLVHQDTQELPEDIAPGKNQAVAILLISPPKPGNYRLTVEIRLSDTSDNEATTTAYRTPIICAYPKPLNSLYELLGEFVNYHGEWICSPWFGFIYVPEYPWIYHDVHGWLKCPEEDPCIGAALRFSDAGLGEWTTTRQTYPMIHQTNGSRTLRFIRAEDDQRIFVDQNGDEIKAVKTIANGSTGRKNT